MDLGTGCGIFAILLKQHNKDAQIFTIDTNNYFEDEFTVNEQKVLCKRLAQAFNANFDHYDGEHIPYPDDTFDIITAYAVIEHVAEKRSPAPLLREIRRVMKKDGLFFVFKMPRKLDLQEHVAGCLGFGRHKVLYGDSEIKSLLRKHGLKIIKSWKSNMVFEYPPGLANRLYNILRTRDLLLYYSPFRVFAHHNNFILQK